jgi:hypothetical protein
MQAEVTPTEQTVAEEALWGTEVPHDVIHWLLARGMMKPLSRKKAVDFVLRTAPLATKYITGGIVDAGAASLDDMLAFDSPKASQPQLRRASDAQAWVHKIRLAAEAIAYEHEAGDQMLENAGTARRRRVYHDTDGEPVAERWMEGSDRCYMKRGKRQSQLPTVFMHIISPPASVTDEQRSRFAGELLALTRALKTHFRVVCLNRSFIEPLQPGGGLGPTDATVLFVEANQDKIEDFILAAAAGVRARLWPTIGVACRPFPMFCDREKDMPLIFVASDYSTLPLEAFARQSGRIYENGPVDYWPFVQGSGKWAKE